LYKFIVSILLFTSTLFGDYYISQGKKQVLIALDSIEPLAKNRTNQPSINYYKTPSGKRLGVDKKLIVSFSNLSIQLYIEKEFSLSLIKKLNSNMFLYQIKKQGKTLELANLLSQVSGIAFAHPDFLVQKKSRTNDPFYDDAWHLNGSRGINVEEAWNYTKGAGIIVGIYDEGIDIEHEDLRANIIGYGNFNNPSGQIDMVQDGNALDNDLVNAPAPASDIWHGTSCAGLIAAVGDNNRGSVGVAPETKLLAVRYANSNISRDIEAFDSMVNHGAAIISNSWGTYTMFDAFNDALQRLSQEGRNGKGVLIFFASGNDGCNMDQYYSISPDGTCHCQASSNYDAIHDESESPYVISIAASTQYNRIADYSNFGSSIDFTAPGSQYPANIITTDAMGSNGAPGSWNYTSTFSGTSAAAPIAAATAALILSENPTLNKEEVLEILKNSADKIGTYQYINGRNDHWGYGRINAGAALRVASQYGKIEIENFAHKIYKNMH